MVVFVQTMRRPLPSLLLVLLALCFGQTLSASPPNILLITLDTTRADRLGCYGYQKASTPNLDRLAGEGAKFESAYSAVPITLPSHATVMTGLYPFHTGVRDNGLYRLPGSIQTLAEVLKANQYHTVAVVSSAVLDRVFGLDQGFDLYDDDLFLPDQKTTEARQRNASRVNAALFADTAATGKPFFLWVHYFDAHFPYDPPAPFSQRFAAQPYDGEIAFVDSAIGELLDHLNSRGLLDNTIIVIAGDHGESLGDHKEESHGVFLYRSTLQVPLVFHYPGVIKPGAVQGPVSLVDVFPTILDYAGIKASPGLDGLSLKEAIQTGRSNKDELYEETLLPRNSFGWSPLFGIRTPQWHFILAPGKELYDIISDPDEQKNLAGVSQKTLDRFEKKLNTYPFRQAPANQAEVSEELKQQLNSLGYTSSPGMKAATRAMDPKDGILLANQIDHAGSLAADDHLQEAVSILESILKRDPGNVTAWNTAGLVYTKLQDYQAAEQAFEAGLKYSRGAELYFGLATAQSHLGKSEEASQNYQKAIMLDPRYREAYMSWAEMELSLDHPDSSAQILDQAISQQIHDPRLLVMRGRISAQRKEYESAVRYYEMAVKQDNQSEEAHSELGHAYYKLHQIDPAITHFQKALSIQPGNPWTLKALAYIYLHEKRDQGRAREYYEKALLLDPAGPDAVWIRTLLGKIAP